MQLHTAIRLQVSKSNLFYSETRGTRSKTGNNMQTIMLIRLAPENELRYVIGVIQQYVGDIHATDLLNNTLRYAGVNTSE